MMTVIELAKRVGVPANVIRYYSRIGLLKPGRNQSNRYKLFCADDVHRLRFVRFAQQLGYSLGEIGDLLEQIDRGDDPCAQMREILRSRVVETRAQLDQMAQMQARMEMACGQWERRGPDGGDLDSLCEFIASLVGPEPADARRAPIARSDASATAVRGWSRAEHKGARARVGTLEEATARKPRYSTRLEEVFGFSPRH